MLDTFLVVLPLMLSPGPANLVSFALAARLGFARVLVFQLGILVVYAIAAFALGLMANQVVGHAAYAAVTLQLLGGLFIVYLGIQLACRTQRDTGDVDAPGFSNGVLLQILNPKYPAVVLAVFANRPTEPVLITAGIIAGVGAVGLLIYSFVGSLVRSLSSCDKWFRILDVGFGALLCIVGIWVAIQSFVM